MDEVKEEKEETNIDINVKAKAEAQFPTKYGKFKIYGFEMEGRENLAIVKDLNFEEDERVPVRIQSKCITGEVLGSLRCDCGAQLDAALNYIGKERGIFIYLDQEGRGIGLVEKIRSYSLQDDGLDTVEANKRLGYEADKRDYSDVLKILDKFGVSKVELLTNNPDKIECLEKEGIDVKRIPLIQGINKYNKNYILTKKKKLKQLIDV